MASSSSRKADSSQRRPLHTSKSFSRIEPASPNSAVRPRASTVQNDTVPEVKSPGEQDALEPRSRSDIFEKSSDGEEEMENLKESTGKLPSDFDELPIELVSLADSFIDSLSAKVHPTPPTVDKLSVLFQDFYILAATHINTHISALSSRQHRESSPSSMSSRGSNASKIRANTVNGKDRPRASSERSNSEQQMLTAEEIAERKRARKMLEHKRVILEEAVERRVCEGIYERIWRHRSTQDEAQDEKLRSKTAALAVVGIGLRDLGIDLGEDEAEKTAVSTSEKENEVREWLNDARKELLLMNGEKYPLGKLQHLKAAHKDIVDTLSHFHPSSSADEIMPMLIYTLITSPPINVISNLYFIQRFRSENKIDGEAAYCLTNLEAAITFLETVDLASLREDETLSGPAKAETVPSTPNNGPVSPRLTTLTVPSLSPAALSPAISENRTPSKPLSSPTSLRPALQVHNRRLSDLFQPPVQVIGAAGDAMLNTADQGFKTIGNSLGDSYKFLVGKLKERQDNSPEGQGDDIIVPKTLDDARKLIRTPPLEDDGSASGGSSIYSPENHNKTDKVLSMIGGRQDARDRSVDSQRSSGSGSGKKVAFAEDKEKEKTLSPLAALPTSNPAIVESMRNLGNSLNPMSRIAGMGMPGMMRGFGRSTAPTPVVTKNINIPDDGIAELTTAFPDLAASLPTKDSIPKVAPPIKRFMEVQNPGELRINEVLELLRDYRRLAGVLKDLGAV